MVRYLLLYQKSQNKTTKDIGYQSTVWENYILLTSIIEVARQIISADASQTASKKYKYPCYHFMAFCFFLSTILLAIRDITKARLRVMTSNIKLPTFCSITAMMIKRMLVRKSMPVACIWVKPRSIMI